MKRRAENRAEPLRRRGGWQLIELMAVLTLTAMLMTASAQLLALVMGLETRVGLGLEDGASLSQLAGQLRRDGHDAVQVDSAEASLTLTLADGSNVTYEARDSTVIRQLRRAASAGVQPNIFRLSSGQVRFEHDSAAGVLRAIHQSSQKDASIAVDTQTVEAAVGLFSQQASAPSNSGASP